MLAAEGIPTSPDDSDGDLPSGRAALALAALAAWRLGAGEDCRREAERIVEDLAPRAVAQPFAHGALLRAAAGLAEAPRQIVVVSDDATGSLAAEARQADADVIAVVTAAQARTFADAGFALFEGKDAASELAYDCRAFSCRLPASDPAELSRSR